MLRPVVGVELFTEGPSWPDPLLADALPPVVAGAVEPVVTLDGAGDGEGDVDPLASARSVATTEAA